MSDFINALYEARKRQGKTLQQQFDIWQQINEGKKVLLCTPKGNHLIWMKDGKIKTKKYKFKSTHKVEVQIFKEEFWKGEVNE